MPICRNVKTLLFNINKQNPRQNIFLFNFSVKRLKLLVGHGSGMGAKSKLENGKV